MKLFSFTTSKKRYPCLLYSSETMYVAQVNKKGDRFVIFQEEKLPEDVVVNGDVLDEKRLVEILKTVLKRAKIKERHIVVGLPELKATTESIVLPNLSDMETEKAVKQKASSLLPFPLQEAYIDWQYVYEKKDENATIMISAIPKSVVDRHVRVLSSIGIIPIAFETTALSLTRVLPKDAPHVSLIFEHLDSSAVVIILHKKGVDVSSVFQDGETLVHRLQRLISYYRKKETITRDEGKDEQVGAIYVCGKNITQELLDSISHVIQLKPVVLSAGIVNIPKNRQSELVVLASLARKVVRLPKDTATINLLPSYIVQTLEEEKARHLRYVLYYGGLGVLLLLIAIAIFSLFTIYNKTSELSTSVEKLLEKQAPKYEVNTQKIKLVTESTSENKTMLQLIKNIRTRLPEGVRIDEIRITPSKKMMVISGNSADREKLLSFKDALEDIDIVSKVEIPLSSLEKNIDIDYRINISW